MRIGWFTTLSSGVLSLILHIVLGALLIISFDFTPKPKNQARKDVNVVEAVAVDKKQVELELARIKKIEEDKFKKEKKRLDDLEKKAKNLEQKRKEEEKKLADTKKKKAAEEKKHKAEQASVAKLQKEKKELEGKRKLEEKKIEEAEEKVEKLKTEGKARIEKVAEEKRDKAQLSSIANKIKQSIENNFNKVGLPNGLECTLRVRLVPGGEVINVSIAKSSGNDIFDRRAVNAIQKASPLPVPDDVATFERLDLRDNNFTFKPTN